MDNLLCEEKHKSIDEKLGVHDNRLNNHGDRLDKLETGAVKTETIVQNLCDQIKALVDITRSQQRTLLAISGTAILILAGFVIWYIQSLPR